ncbi:MAG: hypothetical protein A2W03_07585 [Candidatus Aminicenantes bacterium RBG_16_63_16]|nr:MAG: hypothetical protein A2W03_07585 [Candidatus Aminicenantes bacterium RBG_16_63_16]
MRHVKILSLIAAAGMLAAGPACKQAAKPAAKAAVFGAAPVKVFKVGRRRISEKLFYTGTIEARQKINIMPDVGGKIAKIYVNEGDRVAKGQLLAEMDTEAIVLQLKQAEAAQAVAEASYANAKTNLERMDRLSKEKAVSDQQHEQVKLAYDAAAAQLAQAQAGVNLARHALNVSIMKAPFAGVIASKNAEEGDVINPMMGSMSATSGVLTLVDFSRVKIQVEVSGTDIQRIQKGQAALLECPSLPGQTFKGTVSVVNLAADPQTKKFGIELAADNPDLALRPGTFGQVVIEVSTHESALVIPQKSVLENKYVMVARDGKAVKAEIVLGLQNTTLVEVTGGLNEGDMVIAEGNFGLEDGAPIEITGEVQP